MESELKVLALILPLVPPFSAVPNGHILQRADASNLRLHTAYIPTNIKHLFPPPSAQNSGSTIDCKDAPPARGQRGRMLVREDVFQGIFFQSGVSHRSRIHSLMWALAPSSSYGVTSRGHVGFVRDRSFSLRD